MRPDASDHNPDPRYLRALLDKAGVSQRKAAQLIGISDRMMRYYLSDESSPSYSAAPYAVQFAIECLAASESASTTDKENRHD